MATRQETCYIAVCDDCNQDLEMDYIVHHDDPGDARGYATEHDWLVVGDKLYCENCQEGKGFPCADCDDLVENEGERCPPCRRQHEAAS